MKSVLVGYPAQRMFELVDAIETYPQFLPWCSAADVEYRDDARTRATIHVNYHGIKQSFTTENAKEPPQTMTVKLVQGPFRVLDGEWRFLILSEHACKIDFRLHYEFASKLLEKLEAAFGYIANTMVDAFVKRAEKLYGSSSINSRSRWCMRTPIGRSPIRLRVPQGTTVATVIECSGVARAKRRTAISRALRSGFSDASSRRIRKCATETVWRSTGCSLPIRSKRRRERAGGGGARLRLGPRRPTEQKETDGFPP